jgi:hypothetical protein
MLKRLIALFKDIHTPIAIFVFLVTTTIHLYTHRDLGPQYVNSLYAFYAFLGGHAFTQAKYIGDNPTDATPPSNT